MSLDFEYGINTGNRFLSFVGHDEDPDEFLAGQVQPEEKTKKSTKDSKSVTSTSAKKPTSKTTTTTASTANVSNQATRTNKENLTGKSTNNDQRRQQSNVLGDNNNQQTRVDSGRGGGRGFRGRGGSAGQDRPAYEGGHRGGGPQRTPRYNKFEGQQPRNETGGFEQGAGGWGNEAGNDNQTHGGYRGRGRGSGRGNYMNQNYEGGRGGGRGRGRGGRGNYGNRSFEEGSQQQQQQPHEQQQQTQEGSGWQKDTESNFDNTRSQPARTSGQEFDNDATLQERPFEADHTRRGGRGPFRGRTFHSNRYYGGGDHQNQYEGDQSNNEYRQNRRQHDRQPRTNVSGVKPIEKKDGEGAHNWGNPAEIPDEENPVADETAETTGQASAAPKAWADQVDEAEKQMTLDEYKKQLEEKKRAQQEKIPQFNRRTAGEGEDSSKWGNFQHEYRKKNDGESDEELEEGSGAEEGESEEEGEEEQISGKKKVITIPLRFAPIDIPRGGPFGSRGGSRRGGGGAGRGQFRDRPYREDRPYRDDQPRATSPSQQQSPVSQQAGEYQNDEQHQHQQSRPYRGGPRQGSGRGEYRRSYGNSARGSRGGYDRSQANPSTPNFNNAVDFPTLPKQ
ncbi:unnamed protein product [Adineta steineri]|uniref:Hyaluronan/mRNA-binding protein domain-containing protein n=1 Tax=Adineta steineri TaxID=433720 RepID=A0A814NHU1_9BILA|nr:unnamed protein product [Adineta steineri]CAF0968836.1 unnamed protein product [Adineta steineri]CAF1092435.1 unnamed protein product [Adineta steineri]